MKQWKYIAVFNNLQIDQAIENDYLAIVPPADSRFQNIIHNTPNLKYLVEGFTDQFGRSITSNFLIAKVGSKLINTKGQLDGEALIGFRNAIAISTILKAYQDSLCQRYPFPRVNFSNYFDIYPISLSNDNKSLITRSPSILGTDEPDEFHGQCSPKLANLKFASFDYDKDIFKAIMKFWSKRYVAGRKKDWESLVLFRSLEMAYQASSIPIENNSSVFDIGSRIMLWVSALEVLAHPENGNSDFQKVIDLIKTVKFYSKSLSNKYYSITWRGKTARGTLIEKMYYYLYRLRNDFTHGNPLKMSKLYPFKNKKRSLNLYSPIIYKVALLSFLGLGTTENLSVMEKMFHHRNLEKSIVTILNN